MSEPKPTQIVVEESFQFHPSDVQVDKEKGVLHGAMIFGPAKMDGPNYVSNAGNFYAKSFFASLTEHLDGVLGWDGHPDKTATGLPKPRKVGDAVARVREPRLISEQGMPKIRGDYHFIGKAKDTLFPIVAEAADVVGLSICCPTTGSYDAQGRYIIEGVDGNRARRISVDLVDVSGATKNIFEHGHDDKPAPEANTKPQTQEETTMSDELKKSVEEAHQAAESARAEADKARRLQRELTVERKLAESRLDSKYITESLRQTLLACEETKLDAFIAEHKKLVAENIQVVKDNGSEQMTKETKPMTTEQAIEDVQERGFGTVLEGICAVAESGHARRLAIVDKLNKTPFRRIGNFKMRDEKTRELRRMAIEGWSPRGTVELVTGRRIITERDVEEAAVDSTGFSNINTLLLSAIMIEVYEIVSKGLVVDRLVRLYPTQLQRETFAGYTSATGGADVPEGTKYPDATIGEKYADDYALTKRGVMVAITREEIMFDQKGQVMMRANAVVEDELYRREDKHLRGILDLAANKVWRPLGVQTNVFNGTNIVANNPLTDYTSLESVGDMLKSITQDNSRRLAANAERPLTLLIPSSLEYTADHIRNALELQTAGTTDVGFKQVRESNPWGNTQVYSSQILDAIDSGTWYAAGARGWQKQYILKQNIPFEIVQVPQSEVDNVTKDIFGGSRIAWMEGVVALDNKYVVKSVTGAS